MKCNDCGLPMVLRGEIVTGPEKFAVYQCPECKTVGCKTVDVK